MSSPYEKAKKALTKIGYTVGKVEHWNPWAHVTQDLFGCIDAICMRHGDPLIALQVTTATNMSSHMKKAHSVAVQWISTGNRFEIWAFYPGTKKPPRVMAMQPSGEWEAIRGE